jgi:MFS family permease
MELTATRRPFIYFPLAHHFEQNLHVRHRLERYRAGRHVRAAHQLTAATLTACWSVVFFFASAGVSAAYLTVSEIFPLEARALCIALFYAGGTGIGGIIGPQLFGPMVATGEASEVFKALAVGAILMIVGGVVEIAFGIKAERRGLEGIAKPLTAVEPAIRGRAERAGRASAGPQPQRAPT